MFLKNELIIVAPKNTQSSTLLKMVESVVIEKVLQECRYNQLKTAAALGISRAGLRTKLNEYFPDKYIESKEPVSSGVSSNTSPDWIEKFIREEKQKR